MTALGVAIAVLAMLYLALRLTREDAPAIDPAVGAARAESDAERRRLVAARDPSILAAPTDAPCPLRWIAPAPVPDRRQIAAGVRGTFSHELRHYLRMHGIAADVLPMVPPRVGPLEVAAGWAEEQAWTSADHQPVLLVSTWDDPRIGASPLGGMERGRLTGRLVIWSFSERRVICAADVDARSSSALTVVVGEDLLGDETRDDPQLKARLDLVVQALRVGIEGLRAAEGTRPR